MIKDKSIYCNLCGKKISTGEDGYENGKEEGKLKILCERCYSSFADTIFGWGKCFSLKKLHLFRHILEKECNGNKELMSQVGLASTLYPQHKGRLEKVIQEFKKITE